MKITHPMVLIPLAIIALLIALVINDMARNQPTPTYTTPITVDTSEPVPEPIEEPTELIVEVLEEGSGDMVSQAGDTLEVHYAGTLLDGTEFDSSRERGPFSFPLGAGAVIKGWDQGMEGMKEGEKRKLTIPSDLAYGSRGAGALIPPDSALVFEVELLSITRQ